MTLLLGAPAIQQSSQLRQASPVHFCPLGAGKADRALHEFLLRGYGRPATQRRLFSGVVHAPIMCDSRKIAPTYLLNHNNRMKTFTCGIYTITAPDGRVYVGSSRRVELRWLDHQRPGAIRKMKWGRLYASMREHGREAHRFEVVETCRPDQLLERERHWQETLDACGPNGLNSNLVPTPEKPGQISEATRAKMCEAQAGSNNPNYGKRGPETSTWGRKRPPHEREAILAAQRQRGQLIQQIDPASGVVVREARAWEYRAEGWSQGNISSCCTGRLKTYRGFQFRYKKDEPCST